MKIERIVYKGVKKIEKIVVSVHGVEWTITSDWLGIHISPNMDRIVVYPNGPDKIILGGKRKVLTDEEFKIKNGEKDVENSINLVASDLIEKSWAKANKLKKAVTSTGIVHYVHEDWHGGKVVPFCNYRQWRGDYWGKGWKLTDKLVTCKNCLSKMRKDMRNGKPKNTGKVL